MKFKVTNGIGISLICGLITGAVVFLLAEICEVENSVAMAIISGLTNAIGIFVGIHVRR